MKNITINGKKVGTKEPIFLIAEAGVNHNGKLHLAKKLINVASKANVDAIKFQTYSVDNLILKNTNKAKYQKLNTNVQENFYEMLKKYELSEHDFKILKEYCSEKEIIFLSTPFDVSSVDLLEELNISAYKIGSGDMNNYPLLKKVCSTRKPILLSTGMATLQEVIASVNYIKSSNIEDLIIFQCTSSYPTLLEDVNLNVIDTYFRKFPEHLIGFSDHTLGFEASIGAVAKGVKVIEKHFTLDKKMKGPDHEASLNPEELKKWVSHIRNTEKALGSSQKSPSKRELENAKIVRKSIVTIKDIKKGEVITEKKIGIKRPGYAISPINFKDIVGRRVNKNISKNTPLSWEDIE